MVCPATFPGRFRTCCGVSLLWGQVLFFASCPSASLFPRLARLGGDGDVVPFIPFTDDPEWTLQGGQAQAPAAPFMGRDFAFSEESRAA